MTGDEIQQLFARTLDGNYDDDEPWSAVRKLHSEGTFEVFTIAAEWCRSLNPLMRARGADVIAQLGRTAQSRANPFPEPAFSTLSELVQNEKEIQPLSSAIYALGHLDVAGAVPLIANYRSHPHADVRHAVAFALGSYSNDPQAIAALLPLTADADSDIRDWATFALGVLGSKDTPEIRDALAARLADTDEDAREEAVVGLAKRRDLRTLPHLLELLEHPEPTTRAIEAASLMLGLDQADEWPPSHYIQALKARFF